MALPQTRRPAIRSTRTTRDLAAGIRANLAIIRSDLHDLRTDLASDLRHLRADLRDDWADLACHVRADLDARHDRRRCAVLKFTTADTQILIPAPTAALLREITGPAEATQ